MKIKSYLVLICFCCLFASCKKENTVVYKGFDYADYINREIAEEYKIEFNLDDNTFLISETQLSFPKGEQASIEVEKSYFTKGNFTGNANEDGDIKIFAQMTSEDGENWQTDSYITTFKVENNSFDTDYYHVTKIEYQKNHKNIAKKMKDYKKTLDFIFKNQSDKEKLVQYFEKCEKLSTELLLLSDSEEWLEEDSFNLNRYNKLLQAYSVLYK